VLDSMLGALSICIAVGSQVDAAALARSSSAAAAAGADLVAVELVEQAVLVSNARILLSRARSCRCIGKHLYLISTKRLTERSLTLSSLAQNHVELRKVEAVLPQSVLDGLSHCL